jgi:hypothetical protein
LDRVLSYLARECERGARACHQGAGMWSKECVVAMGRSISTLLRMSAFGSCDSVGAHKARARIQVAASPVTYRYLPWVRMSAFGVLCNWLLRGRQHLGGACANVDGVAPVAYRYIPLHSVSDRCRAPTRMVILWKVQARRAAVAEAVVVVVEEGGRGSSHRRALKRGGRC